MLETLPFEAVLRRFAEDHTYDAEDRTNFNDRAERHLLSARRDMPGRWRRLLLEGPEVGKAVLPWHAGEGGQAELVPATGLTVFEAVDRLAALGASYERSNPLCSLKIARQRRAAPLPLFLSTRPVSGPDHDSLTTRQGLIHLDGLHRMLAWATSGRLVPGRWFEAYVAGPWHGDEPCRGGPSPCGPESP
ncbi:DUF6309 family protein [Streptomyces sp. NPDC059641]|uniref:DUF6309 family protein n=1 Tax=Streptomyces sp. NPDC059641 TaxID=3346892 RepID=UPI0036CC4C9C